MVEITVSITLIRSQMQIFITQKCSKIRCHMNLLGPS